ncbi:OPT oligopeptide transporter protein-domain-containing protein [Phycomyces blakesleeanus]|uniref:OPT oligopeptide transporter protein-domain-containing protein n=1 Tax=Phycomyces blakesleeanus TaxID=4837 RepID=A0ABR3B5A1_PHYBL
MAKPESIEDKTEYEIHETKEVVTDEKLSVNSKSIKEEIIEEWQFTWRASIVGSLLGCLVAASNTYLGLKIGWTFGASLFGAIFSFAIIKPLSRILPPKWGGGYFGAKENCTAQSAATTSGGLSAGFVSGIPAMYKLGLMTTPREDAAALVLFTISAAFYGLFFAVPLRQQFIVKQNLTFPTPRASAITIISLHDTVEGERDAMRKAKWMGIWFFTTFFWNVIAYFVPFFEVIHVLYWIGHAANYAPLMSADVAWRWNFHFDFPFFGAGLMTPGSTVVTFFVTSVVVFGVIGPCMVANGSFVQPYGFTAAGETTQSFFLWPGIALMVISSFAELFIHYDALWRGVKSGGASIRDAAIHAYHLIKIHIFRKTVHEDDRIKTELDPDEIFKASELVPTWWWASGTFISIIFTCAIMGEYFGMPVYQSIIAVILGFLFAFVGLQATGETDINPVGSIGKMSQLVFARMPADDLKHLQKNNLMAGNISASAASQAVDMVGDLKTGQLVGASPRSQFLSQFVASFFAIGIAVGLFILFADAYPCIIDPDMNAKCEFALVAVSAWYNVTKLLTGDGDPLSRSCIIVTVVCAVVGGAGPVLRNIFVPKRFLPYFPSISAIGIAMINTTPEVPLSMFIGWCGSRIWQRYFPKKHEDFMYSCAGGMIAGQGISAIVQAVFTIAGVEGHVFVGSCPEQLGDNCP